MPYGSLHTMANYLINGNWIQSGFTPGRWNLSDTGPHAKNGTITYSVSGNWFDSNGISAARKEMVKDAFTYLSNVTGINFQETNNTNADIAFSDSRAGAYAGYSGVGADGFIDFAYVNISSTWNGGDTSKNGYAFQTIVHEIGHALGLGHMGNYDGVATFPKDATFLNDSWQNSIMSYFDQIDNTKINASYALVQTMMSVDLLGLDRLYGSQSSGGSTFGTAAAFTGDTVYGFNSTISANDDPVMALLSTYGDSNVYTIADGGGIDTLDFSGWNANQVIDLTVSSAARGTPTISDIGGLKGNLTLAVGTVIENARGGGGDDRITGNAVNNDLYGGAGHDILISGGGADRTYGESGNDKIYAGAGNDLIDGGSDLDWLMITGTDRATVDLDVSVAQNTGYGNDTILNIENVWGGQASDVIRGTAGNNVLVGNNGHDLLEGRAGNDKLLGGNHNDKLVGGADNDQLFGGNHHDRLFGGDGGDDLRGDHGADIIDGGAGRDYLFAGVDIHKDVFVFRDISDSGKGVARDRVYQFDSREDDFHFRQIDANTNVAGDQNFGYSLDGPRAHSVWVVDAGPNSIVRADVDGDAVYDFEIAVMGTDSLHWTDFII